MKFKKNLLLGFYLLMLILYRVVGYSGHFGYDDMEYAQMSYQFLSGEADYSNHFSYRFSLIIPTAISYFLMGVNDWSSSIPPIIISALVLTLVFRILQKESIATISIALTMTLFSEWFLFYSNKLMVDIYLCLGIVSIIYSLYRLRYIHPLKSTKYALLFTSGLLFSLMAKGTIILIFPLLFILLLVDLFRKENLLFWKKAILFSTLGLIGYFLIIYLLTDDFFSRFSAIEANGYINRCSYALQETKVVIKRVSRDFFEMLRNEGPAWSFIFIIAALFFPKRTGFFQLKKPLSFFLFCSLILLLSSNFMSISLNGYNPMCIDLRHYLWLIPIAGIATALLIQETSHTKSFQWLTFLLLLILCANTFLQESKLIWKLYFPLSALYAGYIIIDNKLFRSTIFPILFAGIFMIQPISMSLHAREAHYNQQVDFIQKTVSSSAQQKIIFTDYVQARVGNYLMEYDSSKTLFIDFQNIVPHHLSNRDKSILLNPYTQFFAGTNPNNYPFFVKQALQNNTPVDSDKTTKIKFYSFSQLIEPELTGRLLLSDSLGYESEKSNWEIKTSQITDSLKKEGLFSEKVDVYSSTYKLLLHRLQLDSTKTLFIKVSANTLVKDTSNALLVISIDDDGQNLLWKGFGIERFQQVYSNWWTVEEYITLPIKEISANSALSFFLWNKEKEELWIDDLTVKIIEY